MAQRIQTHKLNKCLYVFYVTQTPPNVFEQVLGYYTNIESRGHTEKNDGGLQNLILFTKFDPSVEFHGTRIWHEAYAY